MHSLSTFAAWRSQQDHPVALANYFTVILVVKVIFNLTLTLRDKDGNIKHQHIEPRLPVAGKVSLGWAQNWSFEPGDELEAAASTYYKVIWAL